MKRVLLIAGLMSPLVGCASHTLPETGVVRKSTKSYTVKGRTYCPQKHYKYCACGTASWYGPYFHGRKNACGYTFNKYRCTAAHRTLPLPCVLKVTNLDNNKCVIVLADDRGPFTKDPNRILDLSYGAALKLDMVRKGTARVRVECLVNESVRFSNYIKNHTRLYGKSNWACLFETKFKK